MHRKFHSDKIENNWSFEYKILGHVGPSYREKPLLELLKFHDFLNFLSILRLSYSKFFYSTLNYDSTANIQEVMKFYNLGDQRFETDLSLC